MYLHVPTCSTQSRQVAWSVCLSVHQITQVCPLLFLHPLVRHPIVSVQPRACGRNARDFVPCEKRSKKYGQLPGLPPTYVPTNSKSLAGLQQSDDHAASMPKLGRRASRRNGALRTGICAFFVELGKGLGRLKLEEKLSTDLNSFRTR